MISMGKSFSILRGLPGFEDEDEGRKRRPKKAPDAPYFPVRLLIRVIFSRAKAR
jgi:hypothetical protein